MDEPSWRGYIPLGSNVVAESMRAGTYLEFFNPAPMSAWASRFVPSDDAALSLSALQANVLCRLVYGAISRERSDTKGKIAQFPMDGAHEQVSHPTCIEDFLKLAADVLGYPNPSIRDHIVYSSEISATNSHLYAQEDEVGLLTDALIKYLSGAPDDQHGLNYLCCVLLQVLSIHPFQDGNGRMARYMVIRASAGRNLLGTAALVIGLQWWNRGWFNELAFRARTAGLDAYLEGYNDAFRLAYHRLRDSRTYRHVTAMSDTDDSRQGHENSLIISYLLMHGEIRLEDIKRFLSCSSAKAAGVLERISSNFGFVSVAEERLSVMEAVDDVRMAIAL